MIQSMAFDQLLQHIPSELLNESGGVFYSGRNAWVVGRPLYVIGLNPGGCPEKLAAITLANHTKTAADQDADWSEYRDQPWNDAAPGTRGMAPRVLHLMRQLGLNPGEVPASNLVFVRSRRERGIEAMRMQALADACWPFHEHALGVIRPKAVLCFGKTVGAYVRRRLNAHELVGEFVETNKRRWRSQAFKGDEGVRVVVATHPSIANWRASPTDISGLVADSMRW